MLTFCILRFYPDKEMPSLEPVPGNIIDWRFIIRIIDLFEKIYSRRKFKCSLIKSRNIHFLGLKSPTSNNELYIKINISVFWAWLTD